MPIARTCTQLSGRRRGRASVANCACGAKSGSGQFCRRLQNLAGIAAAVHHQSETDSTVNGGSGTEPESKKLTRRTRRGCRTLRALRSLRFKSSGLGLHPCLSALSLAKDSGSSETQGAVEPGQQPALIPSK